jgi:hypothetical protein
VTSVGLLGCSPAWSAGSGSSLGAPWGPPAENLRIPCGILHLGPGGWGQEDTFPGFASGWENANSEVTKP